MGGVTRVKNHTEDDLANSGQCPVYSLSVYN